MTPTSRRTWSVNPGILYPFTPYAWACDGCEFVVNDISGLGSRGEGDSLDGPAWREVYCPECPSGMMVHLDKPTYKLRATKRRRVV